MNLPFPIAAAAEKAIEAVLRIDPETRERLSLLNGKTIRVNITAPELSVLLSVVDGTIQLANPDPALAEEPGIDTAISGSLSALRSLLDGNDAVYKGQVVIEGDVGVSAHLKQVMAQIDPDWQDAISPYIGDGVTHRLDVVQGALKRWVERTRRSAGQNTREYLQEEIELLAPDSQIRQFCENVDQLRAASDRLSARIARLENLAHTNIDEC